MALGSALIAMTPICVRLADVSPATATFYRSVLALPFLVVLALTNVRANGLLPVKSVLLLAAGGVMLGIDFALYTTSIGYVGAGIASVLVNVQIVVLPLIGWVLFRERPRRTFALFLPVMVAGIAMTSGGLGPSQNSDRAMTSTLLAVGGGIAYSFYLLSISRVDTRGHSGTQVLIAVIGSGLGGTLVGLFWGPVDFTPRPAALGWLAVMAIGASALGWVVIGGSLYRLSADVGAALLLLQPIISLLLGIVLLGESPALLQLIGCAIVIVAVWVISRNSEVGPVGPELALPVDGYHVPSPGGQACSSTSGNDDHARRCFQGDLSVSDDCTGRR